MILYLDTSALVKIYVDEAFRPNVLEAMTSASIVATHVLSFVEAHAAFARLQREGKLSAEQLDALKLNFTQDWKNYLQVEAAPFILHQAANFVEVFALRAYDSVHLSAAHYLFKQGKQAVIFACFDRKLNQAAGVLGLELLQTQQPTS